MNLIEKNGHFDLQSALDRFSGDSELLAEAISIFEEEAVKHLAEINKYIDLKNLEEASKDSHTLKGECGAVGAIKAQALSQAIEKAAALGDYATSRELLPELEKEIGIAIKVLPDAIKDIMS